MLLIGILFNQWIPPYFDSFFLILGKVSSLTLILGLFSMTTRINTLLQLLSRSGIIISWVSPIYYLINTTLAVFPSVQYDIQRAIEAEEARKGRKVRFYSFDSHVNITTIILVRIINRSNRFTQTIIDRGYSLESGLSPIHKKATFEWQNLILTLVYLVPGIIVFVIFEL